MKLKFPSYANQVLNTIENHGFEAWFVGGCVRDSLLGRDYYDIDITTNALPEDVEGLFPHTVPTGKKHGTVTVLIENNPIEVTTYRSEAGYSDNRHPNEVVFEKSIYEDLARRDFTVNALAYNPKRGLLDLFGGTEDLEKGVIRAVGNAEVRFCEDALRILRAFRFASVLDFKIEKDTYSAALSCRKRLEALSGERVLSELKKLASGINPYAVSELLRLGALQAFGVYAPIENAPNLRDTVKDFKTAFLLFICRADTAAIKERLKPDNCLVNNIKALYTFSRLEIPSNKYETKLFLNKFDSEKKLYLEYIKLFSGEEQYKKVLSFIEEISRNNEPYLVSHLKLNGHDLEALGIRGSEIKKTLDMLIYEVIEIPELNTPKRLRAIINK